MSRPSLDTGPTAVPPVARWDISATRLAAISHTSHGQCVPLEARRRGLEIPATRLAEISQTVRQRTGIDA
jgi:hypothetical protein